MSKLGKAIAKSIRNNPEAWTIEEQSRERIRLDGPEGLSVADYDEFMTIWPNDKGMTVFCGGLNLRLGFLDRWRIRRARKRFKQNLVTNNVLAALGSSTPIQQDGHLSLVTPKQLKGNIENG